MSFVDHYLKKHRLAKMPEKMKERIKKIEEKVRNLVDNAPGEKTFEDCLKEYGPEIADLIERVSKHIKDHPPLSFGGVIQTFKFIYSIAVETHQIVEAMAGCVIDDSMSEEEQHVAKVGFGKDLIYFIWMTVDPLQKKFNWIPFKRTIEKKLVMWLAGMALESTVDLFAAQGIQLFSVEGSPRIIKALSD